MRDLLASPILSWPIMVLLMLAVAGGIAWSLWHGLHSQERALALGGFRLCALAILALIFVQPQRRYDEVTILKPQLAVMVDQSESMGDPADEAQPRRAERAREFLAGPALAKAREAFDVRLFSFDAKLNEQSAGATDFKFQGAGSNVVSAVNQMQDRFRGQPLAAVLLLSDGLDTSGAARAATLAPGAPVFAFELEKPFQAKIRAGRISLGNVDYPARVVVGWDSEIHASIVGSGMVGKTVGVELWRNGKKQTESTVSFNEEDQTRTVTYPVAPTEPGMIQYELRVTEAAADADAKNHPFVIEALAPGKRILYLQKSLDFDFKFLRKAIVSDRNLQLNAFVRWGDGRLVSMGERGVPAAAKLDLSAAGLSKYSVVILGDLPPEMLTAENYQSLKEFVNRGGGLVLLGGPKQLASMETAKTALGEVAPVKLPAEYREGNVAVQITDAGLRHPVFGPLFTNIKDFPPLLTANLSAGAANPTTETLVEGKLADRKFPLVAANRFGQGRVVAIMTGTLWSWRLAAKSWGADRSPYDTFWTQLMDWLIPKEQDRQDTNKVELFTERANYLMGERPEIRALVRLVDDKAKPPATVPLSVKTPDGKTFEYTMKAAMLPGPGGRQLPGYRAEVEPNVAGVFAAHSSIDLAGVKIEGETRFVVSKPATEITGKPIDRELLHRIADQTGGHYFAFDERDQWAGNIHYKEQQFSRMQIADLWNNPIVLVLFVAALCGDWILRKRWNLP